ncbi:hypothetical protein QFZ77_005980 [Paenibacillus sp. V4I3]|nr:hypothetical protein [Paenibacillus sp. V4I3]MDQ0886814.1 hypothetical protein [Paenibacillus sp. V4I9]
MNFEKTAELQGYTCTTVLVFCILLLSYADYQQGEATRPLVSGTILRVFVQITPPHSTSLRFQVFHTSSASTFHQQFQKFSSLRSDYSLTDPNVIP